MRATGGLGQWASHGSKPFLPVYTLSRAVALTAAAAAALVFLAIAEQALISPNSLHGVERGCSCGIVEAQEEANSLGASGVAHLRRIFGIISKSFVMTELAGFHGPIHVGLRVAFDAAVWHDIAIMPVSWLVERKRGGGEDDAGGLRGARVGIRGMYGRSGSSWWSRRGGEAGNRNSLCFRRQSILPRHHPRLLQIILSLLDIHGPPAASEASPSSPSRPFLLLGVFGAASITLGVPIVMSPGTYSGSSYYIPRLPSWHIRIRVVVIPSLRQGHSAARVPYFAGMSGRGSCGGGGGWLCVCWRRSGKRGERSVGGTEGDDRAVNDGDNGEEGWRGGAGLVIEWESWYRSTLGLGDLHSKGTRGAGGRILRGDGMEGYLPGGGGTCIMDEMQDRAFSACAGRMRAADSVLVD
ncbi:hypothetical protein R3P38DRAFT_2805862 [Favolaschia claudopus]|uniref:Uncharacterized protein n=1 Tax=Favolaschia claudopus TaxID=2862362 RepID=A0AAV9ZLN8_9AGAR